MDTTLEYLYGVKSHLSTDTILKVAGASAVSLTGIYLGKIWLSYSYFERIGVPTPPHNFLFGNLKQLRENKNESVQCQEWTKQYGRTYGIFEGHVPVLVTSDLDIVQEVFIKQFNNFSARKKTPLQTADDSPIKSLLQATKGRWKRMRLIMNPTFSGAKLKEMGPLIVTCTDRLINQLNENSDIEINISSYLKRFTMDTIWNCAFGLDIDLQNDPDNLYLRNCESFFRLTAYPGFFSYLSLLFIEMNSFFVPIHTLIEKIKTLIFGTGNEPRQWLYNKVGYILTRRQNENINRRDYMQLLLEAQDESVSRMHDKVDLKDLTNVSLEKKLTKEEVLTNLVTFMLAGYETTSTALSYCMFVLATNQEEQKKVREEIDANFSELNSKANTENVKDLEYLDNFIKEVMRFYPIARSIRRCVNETTIKGIKIKPGMCVRADQLTIHFDSELWGPTDPNIFDPSRHQKKRNPLGYLAFGAGPRNCIGMKFALVEMKLALVNLLTNFEIFPSENTPKTLELIEGLVRSPKHGVPVMFKKRNQQ